MIKVRGITPAQIEEGTSSSVKLIFCLDFGDDNKYQIVPGVQVRSYRDDKESPEVVSKDAVLKAKMAAKLREALISQGAIFLFKYVEGFMELVMKTYSGYIIPLSSLKIPLILESTGEEIPEDWNLMIITSLRGGRINTAGYELRTAYALQAVSESVIDCTEVYLSEPNRELTVINTLCGNQGLYLAGKCTPGCSSCNFVHTT